MSESKDIIDAFASRMLIQLAKAELECHKQSDKLSNDTYHAVMMTLRLVSKAIAETMDDIGRPVCPIPKQPQSLREHANDCLKGRATDLDCVGTEGGKATTTTIKP